LCVHGGCHRFAANAIHNRRLPRRRYKHENNWRHTDIYIYIYITVDIPHFSRHPRSIGMRLSTSIGTNSDGTKFRRPRGNTNSDSPNYDGPTALQILMAPRHHKFRQPEFRRPRGDTHSDGPTGTQILKAQILTALRQCTFRRPKFRQPHGKTNYGSQKSMAPQRCKIDGRCPLRTFLGVGSYGQGVLARS